MTETSTWNAAVSSVQRSVATGKLKGLRTHQRNLFSYYLAHKQKHPDKPCYVPRLSCHHYAVHIRAIDVLEERGLVAVTRNGDDYRNWILSEPPGDSADEVQKMQ